MKSIAEYLQHLLRPEVSELALMAGRLPCVKIGAEYKPIDNTAVSDEAISFWMARSGGASQVDDLGSNSVRWTTKLDGIGTVQIMAVRRNEVLQVRVQRTMTAEARPIVPVPVHSPAVGNHPGTPSANIEIESHRHGAHAAEEEEEERPSSIPPILRKPTAQVAAKPVRPRLHGVDVMLADARDCLASDLHVVAERPTLFRVAGELVGRGPVLSAEVVERLLMPVVPERLHEVLDQQGSCDFALAHSVLGRFRVNVSRQRTGLKACFRLIAEEIPTFASLGLPEEIGKATEHHQGLIVVTGPSSHGKTSTLAAIVDLINRETTHHVITVEDPIEYLHPRKKAMISQREVGAHTRTFAAALKGSLRQDPDVIVVGELRDTETVRMALSASETGHLVIATMNTPSAAKTIDRLIDLFPPGDQPQVRMSLAGGLRLIVSQRLIPTVKRDSVVAACELLPGSIALWNLIRDNKTYQIPSLQQRGKSLGIIRLDDSLADLVKQKKVTHDEARSFSESPDTFDSLTRGGVVANAPPPPAAEAPKPPQGFAAKAGNLFGKKG